ncbi:MAG: hypothetical protein ACI4EN_02680, partial [Butyrivibrio sp.]
MKNKIKRITGIFLVLCMLVMGLQLSGTTVKAATTWIRSVDITGVTAPAAGAAPNFTDPTVSEGVIVVTKKWQCLDTEEYLYSGDRFQAGFTYRIIITLMPSTGTGYDFPKSTAIPVTVNGNNAGNYYIYTGDEDQIVVSYSFKASGGSALNVVQVSGLTSPAAGAQVDDTLNVSSANYSIAQLQDEKAVDGATAVFWYDMTDNVWLHTGDVYKEGHIYWLRVFLKTNSYYYYFPRSDTYYNNLTNLYEYSGTSEPKLFVDGSAKYISECSYEEQYIGYAAVENKMDGLEGSLLLSAYFYIPHYHAATGTWKSDATNHWKLCSCGTKLYSASHSFGAWSVTKAATETATGTKVRTCSVCGYKEEVTIPKLNHTHVAGSTFEYNSTNHWKLCSCGQKMIVTAHVFGAWNTTKAATESSAGSMERVCDVCGYKETSTIPPIGHSHAAGDSWVSDGDNHWKECYCGEKMNTASHSYGDWVVTKEATETEEGTKERVCTVCKYKDVKVIPVIGHTHTAQDIWEADETGHWNECECGEKMNAADHDFGEWTVIQSPADANI